MVKIIKLNFDGDLDEVNINIKNDKFNLSLIKESLKIEDDNFKEHYECDVGDMCILKLLGNNSSKEEENIHQLPIDGEYQFFGDLYLVMLSKNNLKELDIENFEYIYNALYCGQDIDDIDTKRMKIFT